MRTIMGLLVIATALLGTRAMRADQIINRETSAVSELSTAMSEQEQLRRYFIQGWR